MAVAELPEVIMPRPSSRERIQEFSGEKISSCYQCEKCTNGCPVTFAMDILPHRLIHLLSLGYLDEALASDTIWVCASCETCSTRCPNGIDIAHIMDSLRQLSRYQGVSTSQESAPRFHAAFLSSIKRHGRVHEVEMIMDYIIKNDGPLGLLNWAGMGLAMFRKGKVKLLPSSIRGAGKVRDIFKRAEGKE